MCETLETILDKILETKELKSKWEMERAKHGVFWDELETGKDFLRLLNSQPDYSKFDDHLQFLGKYGRLTKIKNLANWLVERAIVIGSKQAVDELNAYISAEEVDVFEVMLLASVFIATEYKFCNGVKLIGPKSLPNHYLASILEKHFMFSVIPLPSVQSFLIATYRQKIVHIKNTDENIKSPNVRVPIEKLKEARLCLSLARPIGFGIHAIANSTVAPDNLPFISFLSGWSVYPCRPPPISPWVLEIEMRCADEILNNFSKLPEDFKMKLANSIERLNGYSSGAAEVDKAIDLRVCLESIFLSDDNKEQLRYTLSLRAALFIGKNLEEKQKILNLMKGAYDVTSTAVHTGKLPRKNVELLPEAAKIARDSILKLINEGEVDWQVIELQEKNASN